MASRLRRETRCLASARSNKRNTKSSARSRRPCAGAYVYNTDNKTRAMPSDPNLVRQAIRSLHFYKQSLPTTNKTDGSSRQKRRRDVARELKDVGRNRPRGPQA